VRAEAEIDTSSRMVQLVAQVKSSEMSQELSVGLFVTAEISGLAVDNIISLPRSAMRNDDNVLVVDADNRLRFRRVQALRHYKDMVLVSDGLEAGELVCLSAVQTAIDGMVVRPVTQNLSAALRN
jgi:multidrug efflux pump subunit AcrA (membrane-fusion protein)